MQNCIIFIYYSDDYYHNFLVDVLHKVSPRFKRLVTDRSLWDGFVQINADKNPEKFELVVQECLNSGTVQFIVCGNLEELWPVLTSPRHSFLPRPELPLL